MRWGSLKFALLAVVALLVAAAPGAFVPAHAAAAPTTTFLDWDGDVQPTNDTSFFVQVKSPGARPPTGDGAPAVTVQLDKQQPVEHKLTKDDPDDPKAVLTDTFHLDIGLGPHYILIKYIGNADTFAPSTDELGIATAEMTASPEPTTESQFVTFTFTLNVSDSTPADKRPKGTVAFHDTDPSSKDPDTPSPLAGSLQATWTTQERAGRWTTTGNYSPGSDEFFLPVSASRDHNVNATPGGPPPPATTTTRRPTPVTTRTTVSGRPRTTAALAPINPTTTSTTPATPADAGTTVTTFGSFPTAPRPTDQVAASANKKNDGPPIVVVITTLLALGLLGGVAAFRRYRTSGIDWF